MAQPLIGKIANIKPSHEFYAGHWGRIISERDGRYEITDGSIGSIAPIFNRDEFTVERPKRKKARK